MKRQLSLLLLFFSLTVIQAQTLTGTVVEQDSQKPLSGVKISLEDTGIWTVTDLNGFFELKYTPGETIVFSRSGLLEEKKNFAVFPSGRISVGMQTASIRIKEVVLSAQKKKFSEIEIKEEALQKIQSFSLGDVLQQLPGQYMEPGNNTQMKNIVLRSANTQSPLSSSVDDNDFGNKAFGTQLMINDVVVSNNANMQNFNAANGEPFSSNIGAFNVNTNKGNVTPALANYGADLRQIPTDDIEKIEVIAGIPDAKYGDLTSGLIKVETKTGKRPLQVLSSIIEGTYQIGMSKGFQLNEKGDAVNASVNYMNSIGDPRAADVKYERYSANLLYSTVNRSKTFRNKLGVNLVSDINEGQAGEDEYHGIYVDAENKSVGITNNTQVKFTDSFLKGATINFGLNYGEQQSMRRNFVNSQALPYADAITDAVYYASYTPPQYFNYNYVNGKPLSIFTDADVYTVLTTPNKWIHKLSLGFNYRYNDNFGKGRYGTLGTFSATSGPGTTSAGNRDYDFENVYSVSQYAVYLQDNIFKKFDNNTVLTVNSGLRFDLQNKFAVLSPRLNASYKVDNFIFRGGIGLSTKAPSLNMIYTGPRYIDILLGDYRLPGVYSVAIMQTVVAPANNADLKPSKSWRSELGIDWRLPFATLSLTGYKNLLFDGFASYQNMIDLPKAKVEVISNGTAQPAFEITGTENYRYVQNLQTNGYDSRDTGLEMMMNFKKIESLHLSVGLKGSYTRTLSNKTGEQLTKATENPDISYGIFQPYASTSAVSRLGLMLDYHIPDAGLIISLTTDHFLSDRRYTDGSKTPVAYFDQNLVRHDISPADLDNQIIKAMTRSAGTDYYDLAGGTFHNFHLRVSKDFLSGIRISLYLNNMFNLKVYDQYGKNYPNFTPISFGGNLSYQF